LPAGAATKTEWLNVQISLKSNITGLNVVDLIWIKSPQRSGGTAASKACGQAITLDGQRHDCS